MNSKRVSFILQLAAATLSAVVIVNEAIYWVTHSAHPGPAPFITLLAVALLLVILSLINTQRAAS
jgi:hypothetical protein